MTLKTNLPVWKTVSIGINQKLEEEIKGLVPGATDLVFIEPISQKKFTLDPDAFDIIQKPAFKIAKRPKTIQLAITSLRSLGLPDGTCYNDIFAAAQNAGLQLCPAETGLQLLVQYMDQLNKETLMIAMQPIEDNYGLPSVFTVHHWDGGIALGASCCGNSNVEDEWHADSEWVFMV
jgi:hypothetical protein